MAAQFIFGMTLLTAVYAALSPWILGFEGTSRLTFNNFIIGAVVAVLACGLASALDRTHGLAWTLPVLGVWFIVSPWILRGVSPTPGMAWSNVVAGAVLTALGLTAAYFGMRARHDAATHAS